jgi:hypothetical protein
MTDDFDVQLTVWDDGKRLTIANRSLSRGELAHLLGQVQALNARDTLPQMGTVPLVPLREEGDE